MRPIEQVIAETDALLAQQDFAAAGALLRESRAAYLRAGDLAAALGTVNELMGFERQYGSPAAAVAAAEEALRLLTQTGTDVSRPAAMVVLNAATVFLFAGDRERSLPLFDRAETLFNKYYPAGDRAFAGLFNNRAAACLTDTAYPKAEYYYTRALRILERTDDRCDAAVACFNLAGVYRNYFHNETAARAYAERGVLLLGKNNDERTGYYAYTCRKCAAAAREQGYSDLADILTERAATA